MAAKKKRQLINTEHIGDGGVSLSQPLCLYFFHQSRSAQKKYWWGIVPFGFLQNVLGRSLSIASLEVSTGIAGVPHLSC
jgi:hypothetical protein